MVTESVLSVEVNGLRKTGERVAVEFTLLSREHHHIIVEYLPLCTAEKEEKWR